jgi:transcriptional regulator with XRE-family HTH domain
MNEDVHRPIRFPANRGDFLDWATSEDDGCLSVAGLATRCGLVRAPEVAEQDRPRVFGQLIEYTRRRLGLSLEEFSGRANVALSELLAIERDNAAPTPRALYQLARHLDLPFGKLQELAGLAEPRDERLNEAALRFAARSEPTAQLSASEREAYEEFIKALVESTD